MTTTNIPDAVAGVTKYYGSSFVRAEQMARMAELLALIAKEQADSADKMVRQTRTLIRLTWALVGLSVALLAFTIVLYEDTHQLIQREKITQKTAVQQQ